MDHVKIVIPTLNPNAKFHCLLESIKAQINVAYDLLIIDSDSDTNIRKFLGDIECDVKVIPRAHFNHGKTRQIGVDFWNVKSGIILFLTQDVILANEYAIENIVKCFSNEKIGCAYGRQLPHNNAGVLSVHARMFNYPAQSRINSFADRDQLGIKTAFLSDSFAAYRIDCLHKVGGFPEVVVCEDMYVAAKMLMNGFKVAYCAEACVYHSHEYSYKQEFERYKMVGKFHAQEKWIMKNFGKAIGEGKNFVASEIKYVLKNNPLLIVDVGLRSLVKFIGFKWGTMHK